MKNNDIYTVNLESGMPTVSEALKHLEFAVSTAKSRKYKAIKLIHGYGSSGVGGKIKSGVHTKLISMKKSGKIADFIKGEEFTPFEGCSKKNKIKLTRDSDYLKCNHGITIVIF